MSFMFTDDQLKRMDMDSELFAFHNGDADLDQLRRFAIMSCAEMLLKVQQQQAFMLQLQTKLQQAMEWNWNDADVHEFVDVEEFQRMATAPIDSSELQTLIQASYDACADICAAQHDKARTSTGAARAMMCEDRIRKAAIEIMRKMSGAQNG